MKGKTVLVTGANTGIGRVTAEELAKSGARVVLAGRSAERTRPVVQAITDAGGQAEFLALDLGDLTSVRAAAESFLASGSSLAALVNNAGVGGQRGLTKQGFELNFGTNHLGHFLLTKLLLPVLQKTPGARIVNVSSKSHYSAKGIDFDALRKSTPSVTGLPEYEVSKLANVLFTRELAAGKAGAGVQSVALHPGVVASDVWRKVPWPVRSLMKLFMLSNEEGARTTLHCVTTAEVEDGGYYDKCALRRPSRAAQDPALAAELWRRSEEWVA